MILAILQARMTSPRLPGAAMAPLRGAPMILPPAERSPPAPASSTRLPRSQFPLCPFPARRPHIC